ncbi:MAG TPA: PAS domain S-box protein [Candidatus Limnocylindrales bacterium]|nr:PAS domain S-box protein [Candidatus Limnocylindrales bacterium]
MVERRIEELRQNFANLSDPCGALACLVEVAPCAIALYDAGGQCAGANAAYRELFGREPEPARELSEDDVLGKSGVLFWLRRAFSGETIATPTFWYEHQSLPHPEARRRIALSARAFPMRDAEGEIELVAIAFRDETDAMLLADRRRLDADEPRHWLEEVRRADFERRTNEEQFRAVFEHSADGVMLTDDAGRVLDINPSGCRILGRRLQDVVGSRYWDHIGDTADSRELREKLIRDGAGTAEVCLRRADGELRELELRSVANFLPHRHLTTFLDVTERNSRHRRIARRESHLAESQRIAQVGSWEAELDDSNADLETCLLLCSEECLRIFGVNPDSVMTLAKSLALVHPDDHTGVVAALRHSIDTHGAYSSEHRIIQPDGTIRRVRARAEIIAEEPDEFPVRMVGTLQDITDRARRRPKAIGTRWAARKQAASHATTSVPG